jgi:hypothetical protein
MVTSPCTWDLKQEASKAAIPVRMVGLREDVGEEKDQERIEDGSACQVSRKQIAGVSRYVDPSTQLPGLSEDLQRASSF